MMTLPTNNLRIRLALLAQKRGRARRHRLLPAPVLRPVYPSLLQWDWALANPFRWNVWQSLDNGVTWTLIADYWADGSARQFAPDGGSERYFIVGVNELGRELTEHSNIVRPDDAPLPDPNAPGLLTGDYYWNRTTPGYADVGLTWSFDHGPHPVASLELWASVNSAGYSLLATVPSSNTSVFYPNATSVPIFVRVKARYRNGDILGPFSNELLIYIQAP